MITKRMLSALACASGSLLLLAIPPLQARTIALTADDCDEMASISSQAPRLSWAMGPASSGYFKTHGTLYLSSSMALLMRFPIKDQIPKDQRVTKAELTIAPYLIASAPEVHVRRVVAEWGVGVCHQYRMTYPQKIEWAQPGGRGNATDRNNKVSAVFKFAKIGEQTADVTEDVELWYTGGAANHGWIMHVEPEGHVAYFQSPYAPQTAGAKTWKLQITFEPK